jgi:class 3 adenylate cyclase
MRQRDIRSLFSALASIGDLQGDDLDTRLLKHAVTLTAVVIVVVTLGWILIGATMGSLLVIGTSVVFALLVVAGLVFLARTKRFAPFVSTLFVASLGIVVVGYVTIGGSVAGGSDLTWAILAPIGAVVLYGPRRSLPWFLGFAVLIGAALLVDPLIRPLGTPPPYPFSLILIGFNVLGPGLIAYALLRYVEGERAAAKAQSDRLLLNILPPSIADRLKAGEEHIAEHCPGASVLFADVVDFTLLVQGAPAQTVIELLTALFTRFDELADRHGLEKIKTVGDAYMAAAGVPVPRADHALAAVDMGVAMQQSLADWNRETGHDLRLRVGIASGPVIAGVIGRRKFAYDLWGDTVNVASRMESSGEPGCIQITEATHRELDGRYSFVRREHVEVKGKAPMTTYVLDASRT